MICPDYYNFIYHIEKIPSNPLEDPLRYQNAISTRILSLTPKLAISVFQINYFRWYLYV